MNKCLSQHPGISQTHGSTEKGHLPMSRVVEKGLIEDMTFELGSSRMRRSLEKVDGQR